MRKCPLSYVSLFLAAFLCIVIGGGPARANVENAKCVQCHDEIDLKNYSASVHGSNACTSCHYDVQDIDVHKGCGSQTQKKVETCHRCHAVQGREHFASVHTMNDIACSDCHSKLHEQKKWDGNKLSVNKTCVGCHDADEGVHGAAVAKGNKDAPSCADCHGLHLINPVVAKEGEHPRDFHTRTCQKCHDNEEMMARNNVLTIATKSYDESYHGKVGTLGSQLAAGCSDCHTGHKIFPKDNPKSSISDTNVAHTCGSCHPKATYNFGQFYAHADDHDRTHYPLLYYTFVIMTALLISVFAVFWLHTLLWWRRAYWKRYEKPTSFEFHHPHIDEPLRPYRRFDWFDKTLHVLMAVSFLGLVVTGAPLKFSQSPWAHALIDLLGGVHRAGYIHRVCAVITFVYFGACCAYVFWWLFLRKGAGSFFKRLFGPDSLFPNLRDVQDLKGMFRWFFHKGPEPTFERWTYWEKFDFLAVFWGMFAIGGSGLMLWLPEFFGSFLPGWVFNVAIIVHSDEALLASGFIFTVHFFNTHFRPGKFPMDTVIFRGWIPKLEMWEERGDWVKRLQEEGRLEKLQTTPSSPISELIGQIFGFAAVAVGLACIVLIVWGFASH
jgi:cytochrome b subunit of formate dehydrogenase